MQLGKFLGRLYRCKQIADEATADFGGMTAFWFGAVGRAGTALFVVHCVDELLLLFCAFSSH